MVSYNADAALALKNFALRKPSLADHIFVKHDYKSHLKEIEMKPLDRLYLILTIVTNIRSESLDSVSGLFIALQNEFLTQF